MSFLKRIFEGFSRLPVSGYASPKSAVILETADVSPSDIMALYQRDPACKSSVDLLAAASVGMGFYTTASEGHERAKEVVDDFNAEVDLDGLLNGMAKVLVACGNDFWLKLTPEKLVELRRLPVDAVERIECSSLGENLNIPFKIEGYKLSHQHGGQVLKPEALIHWKINTVASSGFGIGILHVLLQTLRVKGDTRPSYAWMKAKIEKIMPRIFEKYAGPDVLAYVEKADQNTVSQFQNAIRARSEEGTWLFYNKPCDIKPVQLDPRARFEYYVDHIVNQFYLGCETPLPRLFSTPGFTEASANAALELQAMLVKPVQRYIKRQVERCIFAPVLRQAGYDPSKVQVRLNWGSPKVPDLDIADMLRAAELGLIRSEEFRKNAVKFGWELWEPEAFQEAL